MIARLWAPSWMAHYLPLSDYTSFAYFILNLLSHGQFTGMNIHIVSGEGPMPFHRWSSTNTKSPASSCAAEMPSHILRTSDRVPAASGSLQLQVRPYVAAHLLPCMFTNPSNFKVCVSLFTVGDLQILAFGWWVYQWYRVFPGHVPYHTQYTWLLVLCMCYNKHEARSKEWGEFRTVGGIGTDCADSRVQ